MAHLSKQQLKDSQLHDLFTQLNQSIATLNATGSEKFLNDLLGKEEKIMLAKRLAAVVMFIEGNSIYRTSQLLLISPSTAERIKHNYNDGQYVEIERLFKRNQEEYLAFWKTLDLILSAGMPPMGRGRWKSFFNQT